MTDQFEAANPPADLDHEIGENNVQMLGLDVHNPVFAISAILVVAFVAGTLMFLE